MKRVLLIGGMGFVGKHLAQALAKKNISVLIPTRRREGGDSIRVNPLVDIVETKDYDIKSLVEWMHLLGDDAVVINLAGILHDKHGVPYGPEFTKTHVEFPRTVVAAMKQVGLTRLIHMSALGADPSGPSMYLRSKGDGESVVKNSGLDWTIFRPSVMFGEDDTFVNMFGSLLKIFPIMPLAGAHAKFQPVFVGDVAEAFAQAVNDYESIGKIFELGGPSIYTLAEIVRIAGLKVGKNRPIIPLPNWMAYLQAGALEHMPGRTLMSRDNLASMQKDNVLSSPDQNVLMSHFGIHPTPLESVLT